MTFLNPLLLYGMGAIAVPIIIHLLLNRRIKPVVWAAMRFLIAAIEKNQRRMNIEDLLLLALRCLLLILLALALARPVFRGSENGLIKGSETIIVAIDNSYSMGQTDGGATRFDLAKQAGEQVVNSLAPGSSVAVLLFSDAVRGLIPEPTYDLNLAGKVIRDATLSDRPTDVSIALKQGIDTLSRHTGGLQGIYLITDGQESGWKQMDEIQKKLRTKDVKTRIILVGNPEDRNLCVSDLQLVSSIATVGEAAQFDVEVSNYGIKDATDVAVRLSIDSESPSDEGVINSIPAGGSKRLSLFTKFREAGYHTVTGQINGDHLPCDDRRTIALRANDDVRVLLVNNDTSKEPSASATFYLRNALTPAPTSDQENYFVKTKTIVPAELDSTKLSDYEAVALVDVADVSPSALEALSVYVDRGGGLIIFPGSKTNPVFYNEQFAGKRNILPATLGAIRGKADQQDDFFTLQDRDYAHPIVSIWNDPGAGTLASAHFYRAFELKPVTGHTDQAGEARTILKYTNGAPAVMERTWGRGRVILFSSSANTAWNDLPLRPSYLPLIDRTLGSILVRQDARLNIPVGTSFEYVCEPEWVGKDAIIARSGESKESNSLRRIGMVENVPLLRFDETDKAGGYEATIKADTTTILKFAAQSDAAESNLTSLSQAQLDALAPVAKIIRWTTDTRFDEKVTKERSGSELWTIFAILVLIVACVESVLAGIFSDAK